MKLIRYLEEVKLLKSVNTKQANGVYKKTFEIVGKPYQVQARTLNDEVSATIYGANIVKMLNISSPLGNLEALLMPKVDNTEDNISLYFIERNNHRYKIVSVTGGSIDLERV